MALERWLWVREDGQAPKVVGVGVRPPGPGVVLAVQASAARSADEIRDVARRWLDLCARLGKRPIQLEVEAMARDPLADQAALELLRAVREVAGSEFAEGSR